MTRVAFVAIGRNEGQRLKHCLHSLRREANTIIYVDSGSTDGSREFAAALGVEVIDLDTTGGFTMARGRNAGLKRLMEISPDAEYVHFIDGDCELLEGWLPAALSFAEEHPEVAAVCGRRRERHPEISSYNLLCEIEWNTPLGESFATGGDALMRISALISIGGFNEHLIAFEEPDLCRRLRNKGWQIWRLDADMTLHDANILHFRQWWKRHERAGYGAVVITRLCLSEGDTAAATFFGHQVKSPRRWVVFLLVLILLGVPCATLIGGWTGALTAGGACVVILLLQVLRIAQGAQKRCPDSRSALLYGLFTLLAKIPQTIGQFRHARDWATGRRALIIEYK